MLAHRRRPQNDEGMATIEALPMLVIFVMFITFGIGLWGVVHTGIVNSMAARNYAFETFNFRSDVTYFHDRRMDPNNPVHYQGLSNASDPLPGVRLHGINSWKATPNQQVVAGANFIAPQRPLAFGRGQPVADIDSNDGAYHSQTIIDFSGPADQNVRVSPVWIMIAYGICVNARCGDQ
ncbi:MAG: hypothetical protein CL675_00810 [Bdellovibrionaceae bacterium]|nr:hypothetical protein [Pseudobdellovibrionaceae bacterium]